MKKPTKVLIISMLAIFVSSFFFAYLGVSVSKARETPPAPDQLIPGPAITVPETVPGTVNCFDYYKFGSVQVDVESEIGTTVPGVPMTFKGTIKNDNDYPVVDGQVYVKVFRKQTDLDKAHANGFFLQDQFFAAENMNLNAKENKVITFDWKIPNYALPGEYQIATFFTSAKKFNLLGLSFTDDVVGNTFNFIVKGENKTDVEFNKNTVKVNDKNYHFAAFPPRVDAGKEITIKTDLVNSTNVAQSVPVTWTLYSWDGLQAEKMLDTKNETIQLNPNETKNISYTIQNKDYPVYFLVAEAQYKDTKSILDIRTVRTDVNRTRINFPAVTNYPLKQNEKNTLFVCAHNSGTADMVDNNKLMVTLLDENQKEIHKYTYAGKISGAMMGLKEDFTPKENYESFYIKSELYTDNKLVDSATMKYDCPQLTPGKCTGKGLPQTTATTAKEKSPLSLPMLIGITCLLAGLLAIIFYKKKHNSQIGMFLLAFILGAVMFVGGSRGVEAKSVVWNKVENKTLWHYFSGGSDVSSPSCHTNAPYFYPPWDVCCISGCGGGSWSWGVVNPNITITYNAQIVNVDTGALIFDGSNIPIGTKIRLEKIAHQDTDISWFGTGYVGDSPYGAFLLNATNPTQKCDSKFFVGSEIKYDYDEYGDATFDIYVPLSVNLPAVSFSRSGTAGLSCDGTGSLCVVNSAGTINASIIFGDTYGKFYYRYNLFGGCYSNGVPMELSGASSAYQLSVPAQTITYNLTAVAVGNPPSVPAITSNGQPSASGTINSDIPFEFVSTDPNNDNIYYQIDLNASDGTDNMDQRLPGSGNVASGISQTTTKQWTTTGAKTIKAKACDIEGNCSVWSAPFNIAIADYFCTGLDPANATLCNEDNIGLTADTAKTAVSACSLLKCEYMCTSPYTLSSGSCTCVSTCGSCSGACGAGNGTKTCTDCYGASVPVSCDMPACREQNWKEVAP